MSNVLEYNQLQKILPQAYPFVLLDRVTDFKAGEYLTAIKNITANDCCGGDPLDDEPSAIFPEVFLIEAAAQAALVLYEVSKVKLGDRKPVYKFGQTKAEFIQSASIGNQLEIQTSATKMYDGLGYMDNSIYVKKDKIAEIRVLYSVER